MGTQIRRDLFAVKVFSDDGKRGDWCYVEMYRSLASARNERTALADNIHRDYPLVEPKIVHPSQRVVDIFLSVGNTIKD